METISQSLRWVLEHLAVLQPLPGVADPVCFEDFLSQAWRMHSQHDKSRPGALQVSATRQAGPPAGTYVGAAGCCQASASHLLRPACMKAKLVFFCCCCCCFSKRSAQAEDCSTHPLPPLRGKTRCKSERASDEQCWPGARCSMHLGTPVR